MELDHKTTKADETPKDKVAAASTTQKKDPVAKPTKSND
jgi:hypothetical protein